MKNTLRYLVVLFFLFSSLLRAYPTDNFKLLMQSDSIEEQDLYQPLQFKIELITGWKTPYGTGLDFSFMFNEIIDANFGCGISISGTKTGLGTRFYPIRNKSFSPMIGAFLFHSAGQSKITVSFNEDSGIFRINPDNAILINGGFRLRFGKGHYLITGLGYSIPFKGEDAEYLSGSTLSSVQSLANTLTIGGISMSFGIVIKLSKGNYRL